MQFKGYLHNNPDRQANKHLQKIVTGEENPETGWGAVVTPDELRYVYLMGNSELVTLRGAYLEDSMLQGWIDQTVYAIAEELEHDIYPQVWRHRPVDPSHPRVIESWARWDNYYTFKNVDNYRLQVRLRRKPIIRVEKFDFYNTYLNAKLIDLLPRSDINYDSGDVTAVFGYGGATYGAGLSGNAAIRNRRLFRGNQSLITGSFYCDYVSGYDSADRVPADLKDVIGKILAIKIMSAYGDGLVGGLANFSISVGVLHESVGTTMSATSAYFGARIQQLQGEVKDWYENNKMRYRGVELTVL